ncbi:MAG TPA: YigZ family protein [bacterium]|nr:YigZ family protein [bacterium]
MKTIKGISVFEDTIKKSRFVARASRADTPESAVDFLQSVSDSEASHNCWAYKIEDAYRFSDDGEPGGTAGRPIFTVIEQQEFDHIMVVVTRYFGGIKLGAGGLVRAYAGVAGKCLNHADTHVVRNYSICELSVPFEATGIIYPLLDTHLEVKRLKEHFNAAGICFLLQIPAEFYTDFVERVTNALSGKYHIRHVRTIRQ